MCTKEPPEAYEFNRVVFGINSSPFMAQFVTQENARSNKYELPLAAETVEKSTYMDDSLDSVEDEATAIELYKQLTELWGRAGMHAHKWMSNSLVVLDKIPKEDRLQSVCLSQCYLPSMKTLGLLWIAERDVFRFTIDLPDLEL